MVEEGYALGLDLGTTFSCIGIYKNGGVEIIPNRNGDRITPSMVTIINKDTILKGEETLDYLVKNYDRTIYAIKRFIGREYNDKKVQEDIKKEKFPFKIIGDEKGKDPLVEVTVDGENIKFSLQEISSFVVRKMVDNAEKFLQNKVKELVITVPANFDNAQRSCTRQAATLAGIEVLRIINEPTAAALAYRLQDKEKVSNGNGKILVFDLGGGTFDVTVLTINKDNEENFDVLSTKGDKFLGGEDFDNKLVNHFLDNFCKKIGENKDEILKDKKIIKYLKISCENIKRQLSNNYSTILSITNFYKGKDLIESITRSEFEDLCQDLFDKLKKPLNEALKDAKITTGEIKEIVLVGGSTRIPKIKIFLKEFFGENCKINDSINPDEAVAYGATLMAAKILFKKDKFTSDFNLMDITPLSLGVGVKNQSKNQEILNEGKLMSVIIKRASKIPSNKFDIFETSADNQTVVSVEIYEGEKKYVKYNHILGKLLLKDLPPKPKGEVKIKVKLFIDVNGILTVTAFELDNQGNELRSIKTEIEYQSIGLNKEKLEELKIKNKKYYDKIKNKTAKDYTNTREELKDLEEALKENIDDEDEKYNILMTYNNIYEEFINSLDKVFDNENLLERYYLYMKELFESYANTLNINKDDKSVKEDKSAIIKKINDYVEVFLEKSPTYLYDLLNIIQKSPKKYFYEVIINAMEMLNECGKKCLKERKEFCRYNCLIYFERASSLFTNYIVNIEEVPILLRKKCKEQIGLSLLYINDIKTGAILLLEDSLKKGELISKNTGFTNKIHELKFSDTEEIIKYELILHNYEKMLSEINQNQEIASKKGSSNTLKQNFNIKEAICIANIVKISYSFLGKSNHKRLIELCGRCEVIARELDKINEPWYKEFNEIYEDIQSKYKVLEEYKRDMRERIKKKYKSKFDEIESKFNKKKNDKEFIDFILKKYPYKPPEEFEKDKREKKHEYSERLKQELLKFLISKYHADKYEYKDNDEQSELTYCIVEEIEADLNNIFETIQ